MSDLLTLFSKTALTFSVFWLFCFFFLHFLL